jgi:biotin transporter BioY
MVDNVGLSLDAVSAAGWGKVVTFTAPKTNIGMQMIPLNGANATVSLYGSLDGVTFSLYNSLSFVGSGFGGIPTLANGTGAPIVAARAHLESIGTTVGTSAISVWIVGY